MDQAPANHLLFVYATYVAASLGLTLWLARTLFKNGAIFLEGVFQDTPGMAQAVNRLLVVGFYLLNLGYACLLLQSNYADSMIGAVEILAYKLGLLLLSLGGMHFANLYLFYRIRRRSQIEILPPPVAPQLHLSGAKAQ